MVYYLGNEVEVGLAPSDLTLFGVTLSGTEVEVSDLGGGPRV